jgi:ketosteroid isomerase-like protein
MSEETTEFIRRSYELANAGDVEQAKALAHPDCELDTRFAALAGHAYRGHEGIEQWFADVEESWEGVKQTPLRFIELDEERTIAVVRFEARGRASGVHIDQEIAVIWTIRDGKCARLETHGSLNEAFEAAGLQAPVAQPRSEQ